jgi:diguanylate cyclase (GGDEF)-like protein/PAS domain S-box-containing protein
VKFLPKMLNTGIVPGMLWPVFKEEGSDQKMGNTNEAIDQSRADVLHGYRILDTPREKAFDDLARFAAEICDVPLAFISFIDGDRQWFKAGVGNQASETPFDTSFCRYTMEHEGVYIIPDASKDARFSSLHCVLAPSPILFYAGVRLVGPENVPFGTLGVMDLRPRDLTQNQVRAMRCLADQVITHLELRKTVRILSMEREEKIRVLEFAGVHQWRFDFTSKRVTAGPELYKLFGLEPGDNSGIPLTRFFDAVHPEDQEALKASNAKSLATGKADGVEFRLTCKEGVTRWYSGRSLPDLNEHGIQTGQIGVTVDITHLKEAQCAREATQNRLQRVLEQMPARVCYWDTNLVLRFANEQLAGWLGKSVGDIINKPREQVLPPHIIEASQPFADAVLSGETQSFDRLIPDENGELQFFRYTYIPDFKDGEVVGFFALGVERTDIWKSRLVEEERQSYLRPVLDAMPVSIAYWDASLVNRFANKSYLKLIGKEVSEVEGKTLREIRSQDAFAKNARRITAVLNGKAQRFETKLVDGDGGQRDTVVMYVPDFQEGRVAGFYTMIFDVTDRKHVEADLLKSQERLKTVIDNMPAMIGYWTSDLKNEFANKAYFDAFGLTQEEIHDSPMRQVIGNKLFQQSEPYLKMVLSGKPQTFDRTTVGPTGKVTHSQATFIPDIEKGKVKGFYALEADITDRREAELSLMEEKERGRVTLNAIGDGVITADCNGLVNYLNPKAEHMTGWTLDDAKGAPIDAVLKMVDEFGSRRLTTPTERTLRKPVDSLIPSTCTIVDRVGKEYEVEDSAFPILDSSGNAVGTVLVLHDVSEEKAMASRMAYFARHDALTGLPNRVLLLERLEKAMTPNNAEGSLFAVVFLDVDHFKNINDSVGHEVGDGLLRAIADRLSRLVKAGDTVCRMGGDEFILLLTGVESADQATFLVQQIVRALAVPYQVNMAENSVFKLSVTASAGVAMFPEDGVDRDTLMRRADVAMYLAKQAGRNRYQFFSADLDQEVLVRHSWLQDMREAIDNGEFRVHYQPKVSTKNRAIVGVEALVRWQRPTGEMISPGEFIPLAEKSGLIVEIGAQVLFESCRQYARWKELGLMPTPVSVNVSAVQLAGPGFVEFVASVIDETGIQPDHLELEITESSLMVDVDKAALLLYQLKELGLKISLDDFGTGYSSLSYLRRFPLDCIKIDRSFVSDLTTNSSTAAIMKTICNLGRTLNLQIVAEGVETEAQAQLISSLNCDAMQGYLFSKPVKPEVITRMLPYNPEFLEDAA